MPIERTTWECQHCRRRRLMNKSRIVKHEKECWYNPEVKSCLTCKHVTGNGCAKKKLTRGVGTPPVLHCSEWEAPAAEDGDDHE